MGVVNSILENNIKAIEFFKKAIVESRNLSKYQLEILTNGPKSLSQSWVLGAMHGEWRKMKGYKYPDPPDCSSSFEEFNQSVKKYFKEDKK